jgi:hypothetical protein
MNLGGQLGAGAAAVVQRADAAFGISVNMIIVFACSNIESTHVETPFG